MTNKIVQPLWYHPTTVMLVDDDKKFLKSLSVKMNPNFPTAAFDNPKEALEFLKKHTFAFDKLSKQIISEIDPMTQQQLTSETVAINFSPLRDHLNKPDRFQKILLVIIDKVMDEMDGIELCREIQALGLPVKLILLTGNVNDSDAVATFNDRIIHGFIQKTAPDMMEKLNKLVVNLTFEAFCDATAQLSGPVQYLYPLLSDKKFKDFIKKHCPEDTLEIYVIDSSGSCLCITKSGKAFVIFIKNDEDFRNAYEIADMDTGNSQILKVLKEKTAFPFTGEDSYYMANTETWKVKMVPMKKHDELNFYYAVVELPTKKVMSLDHYIKEIWKPLV